jgi:sialidase-1
MSRGAVAAVLLRAVLVTAAPSAEPFLEKTDLFEAGKGGYALYRIPGLVVTGKGTLLAFCEARKSGRGDWGTIDILLRRSTDGGKTWSAPRKVARVDGPHRKNPAALAQKLASPEDVTYNNPVPVVDRKTGAVHFLFCLEYMRCFYRRSEDDGQTFTKPVEITAAFEKFRPDYDWKVPWGPTAPSTACTSGAATAARAGGPPATPT